MESRDTRATAFALLSATLMIGHQVAGKATRDALFLSEFDITQLPKAVVVAAVLSMLAVLSMSRLLARFGPHPLVPVTFAVSATAFVLEWFLFGLSPGAAVGLLYLHMAVFGAILISGFWSVVNERFDPHAARHTIGRVAAAASLGGLLGGLLAERVTALTDLRTMYLVLAGLHLACMGAVMAIGGRTGGPEPAPPSTQSGLQLLVRDSYMRRMAMLIALVALVAALLDYVLKAEASTHYDRAEDLVAFFATFYAILGLASFGLQSLVGSRILERISPGRVLATLPLMVLATGTVALTALGLGTAAIARGGHALLANSLFRSAFELLYTPVPTQHKRPTKTIIDVAADRFGDMVGGGLVLLILALAPALTNHVVIAAALLVAGLALYVINRLYRGYIGQLASNLRHGVATELRPVLDPTTQYVLAEAGPTVERRLLMDKVRRMRDARKQGDPDAAIEGPVGSLDGGGEAADPGAASPPPGPPPSRTTAATFTHAVAAFSSRDPERIRRAIASESLDIRLTPYIIPLLEMDEVAEDVRTELRWQAPRITGQLTDALLDPDLASAARVRIPSVLEVSHSPRAVHALLQGLDAFEFNIRYACGRALSRMRHRNAALQLPRHRILTQVRRELTVDTATWQSQTLRLASSPPSHAGNGGRPPALNRSTEHVFSLLGLVLDQDAMALALQALGEGDRTLRGTALEYLGNVVPEDIRDSLWHRLATTAPRPTDNRSPLELLAELRRHIAEGAGQPATPRTGGSGR
ncbi:MAG: Npt1/Npt2 family nucleotide transporter [Gammaproteobacteria bacterium]|nr:Npt1/Npt2 family nucleotide transporter [Gammaproteobacteria bacterium]